ncbi:MAG: alpha-2-macroglobulin family protein [Pyrinomonadaceae bacterium]
MKKSISFILLTTIYMSMIAPFSTRTQAQIMGKTRDEILSETPGGLKFSLSEGTEGAENRTKPEPANTDPLSEGETSDLLKRLPNITAEDSDKTDFAKRAGSLPAPKTGKRIPVKFPADESREVPDTANNSALEVVRFSPEGDVALAPDLSVTFSHPMVAVTSQEGAAQTVPVQLTPNAEGKWRWLGTKTLMFDTTKRFRMATKYTARVPAGTKSATGQVLAKDVVWTFTTPPPKIEQHYPAKNSTTRRDEIMFASFDQEIDPKAVLESISVISKGKRLPIRLASEDEVKSGSVSYYIKNAQPNRWIAFRAVNSEGGTENALPADSPVSVTINKGTPSAEGPLKTTVDQNFAFKTYGAMKFVEGYCNRGSENCSPFQTWYLRFTNSIDSSKFDKSMVKITPTIEGVNIYPSGQYVYIQGVKKGSTTYTVSVSDEILDVYEQKVQEPATVKIKVGTAPANMYAQGGNMVVLDPTTKSPSYSIYSTNHKTARVKMYRVAPKDWTAFQKFIQYRNYDDGTKAPMPGTLISNKLVSIENKPDELVETRIDLTPGLKGGFGNVVVDIEPTVKRDKYDRTQISTWIQSTNIGLDAFVDSEELVGFATDLKTGKSLADVELSIYPNGEQLSSKAPVQEEKSYARILYDWLTSWGSTQPNEIQSFDGSGNEVVTETIEKAQSNRTPANGILRLPLPSSAAGEANLLVARKGNDIAFLPENSDYYWRTTGTWYKKSQADQLRWFVFDDRKMYRPKEEVSVKGYVRTIKGGELGDVAAVSNAGAKVAYSVKDPRNNEIGKGVVTLNPFGAFDLKFKLADNANLGNSYVQFYFNGTVDNSPDYTHTFQIQEFRRPEFEVSSSVVTEAPHFVGNSANVEVEAKYYAGGGLANADVNWNVRATATNYTPPNRDDYVFGSWVPWWYSSSRNDYYGGSTQNFKGVTDASGKHNLKIDFESVKPPRPYRVTASSSVQDVNRQTWSSTTSLLVHPADLYVGIKSKRTFVQKSENIEINSIVSDLDGKLVAGRNVEIKAILKAWTFEKGGWVEKTVDEQFCTVKSTEADQTCKFVAKNGGRYIITALVMDDRERFNESEMTVWVAGGKTPPQRNVEQEKVELIPSQKDFKAGDTAEILVIAPFYPAEGVLTLRREGIVKTERFTMNDSSMTLKIPLEEAYLPNIHAQVDLVGATARTDDKGEINEKLAKRPAFASGSINLPVSTESRELKVSAEPVDKTVEPAGKTNVNIDVKDYRGEPVANTEVAVVVVDESVLALSGYQLANPLNTFYTNRGDGTTDYHLRKDVLLGNPDDVASPPPPPPVEVSDARTGGALMAMKSAPAPGARRERADGFAISENAAMADEERDADDATQEQINLRKNFDALAVFAPSVKTDSNGKAVVAVQLPDNLTRYRVMAVSVDQVKRFGKGESSITAKQPLMVRPSAPRFMNFGDKIELPVVVQNQTDKDMTVNVGVRATNAKLTNGGGRKVVIKANDRAEVRFPVSADMAGTARFQFAVNSGRYSDAAEIDLPVWTPATTEAFATYGTTDQNGAIVQPIQAPKDVYSQFGGLEVTTSSTQLQELTDAFIYLYKYQFACTEQISSRMLSIAALKDVLTAFKAEEMPSEAELKAQFARDIKALQSRQNSNGYFGLWRRDGERYKYPFVTAHAAHALILAKQKGFEVPKDMLTKVKPYLKDIEKHYDEWHKSQQVRWTISAYALYVRNIMGDNDEAKAKKLLAEATIEKMPFEALGWLMPVLVDGKNSQTEVEAIKRFLLNRTSETAATAQFNTDYGDGAWVIMYSNRRADAVLLEGMLKADKDNDLVPKITRGLLDHRQKGRWSNTQENVFILLALDKYFQAYEKVTPNFVNQVWLGNAYAGEQKFAGRSVDSNQLEIPMDYLMKQGGAADLILNKQGAGRLYYRIGMKYAPKNLNLKPADYGFTVLRTYEAVDNADDVKQEADGKWTIKAGARVRVKLTMVAQARRYHVALVDPLPAGLEILNPDLAVTEDIPAAPNGSRNTPVVEYGSPSYGRGYYYWRSQWFEHQNFRDERAEAFSSLLWSGVYNYTYVARATTPGEFVVPPAKAEEMYHPETFGRTGTDFVTVK